MYTTAGVGSRRMLKKAVQRGRSERGGEAYPCGTLSLLSDARTKLADFFSILLGKSCDVRLRDSPIPNPISANVRLRLFHEGNE